MEVGGVVSFASGAMESLLAKLQSMADGTTTDTKTKGLGTEIKGLKDDLEFIRDNLRNFALMRERTVQAKQWMKQVRETVYDIEDWVDDYQHRADREAGKSFRGLVQKVKNLGARDQLPSSQIKEFKVLINDANERLKRYGLKRESSLPSNAQAIIVAAAADPEDNRVPALRAEETGLVGMDAPVKNVLDQLELGVHKGRPHLMFTFLVGSGGLGKTTLARQVWRCPRLQQQFQLLAFVHAGRNSSVKTVLMSILDQVIRNWQRPRGYESWNEQQVINELKGQLGGKKYLIVIDDVWSSARWQVIKCALPEDKNGSRVIITTHREDIAASSCMDSSYVHEMKPLSSFDDQKELFRGRILGLGKGCCTTGGELAGMADDMLKKCGGVPLAIIVLAGIMVGTRDKSESQLRSLCNSIIQDLEEVEAAEAVSKILYLSYTDLPSYLKSCFLYLSVFPEGYVMGKDRVIRRWIAEGFIGKGSKGSSQETGESCFNELITRGLIQPLPVQDDGERGGYIVHDSARELIISLLAEENFVTVSSQLVGFVPHDKIRRLSLQYNDQLEVTPTMPSSGILSNVRSLSVFGRDEGKHDPGNFRFLRVLDLEDAEQLEKDQLQGIHKLFQLKYLGLGGGVSALPKQVEELENLQTLDIRRTRVQQLAADDGGFQRLAHLLVTGVELPSGVGKMKELQELSMVDVSKGNAAVQSVRELGELLNLRILGLKWSLKEGDKDRATCEQSLIEALNKLGERSLQHLCLDVDKDCSLGFLVDSWSPSSNLREFKQACSRYYFPHVPKTMAEAKLPRLTYLEIGIATVSNQDLDILGGLPALIILKLRSGASGDDDKQSFVVIGGQGFRLLQLFWFERRDGAITGLAFKEGAMPKLRKLRLRCKYDALGLGAALAVAGPNLGLGNLGSLKQIHVKMDLGGVANPDVEAAEAAITKAANAPSACKLEISV